MTAVRLTAGGFAVREGWFSRKAFVWGAIRRVQAVKLDRFSYEEDFLVLTFDKGSWISLGEFDKGFADFEAALCRECQGCDPDWRRTVAGVQANVYFEIWAG